MKRDDMTVLTNTAKNDSTSLSQSAIEMLISFTIAVALRLGFPVLAHKVDASILYSLHEVVQAQ
eukprot:m.118205 g.118205  ORF g.118205 m.118205 type:complete len:64 (-) comp13648_c0_seq1:2351-2542(-)